MASMAKTKPSGPKRVVYLWGAGATQAEVDYLGAHTVNLLMRDSEKRGEGVATRILKRLPTGWRKSFLADQGTDIEKLISLLGASGVSRYLTLAERIRRLYFEDIRDNLAAAKVLLAPHLATGLLTMHANESFKQQEALSGIISTNHDGLLQLAWQKVSSAVNIGVPFVSSEYSHSSAATAPLLQLHGSFTWTFGLPLRVSPLAETTVYSQNTVWIPPTILKETKTYPFNKLAGTAYEILSRECDVLRVVGSALSQNDWNILSMIFNAQRHREVTKGAPIRIELIMPHKTAVWVKTDCSYLRDLTPIGFLTEGEFAPYKEQGDVPALTSEMENPLFYWLKQKIQFHQKRGDLGAPPLDPALRQIAGDIQ
jgi:hypothetical protein